MRNENGIGTRLWSYPQPQSQAWGIAQERKIQTKPNNLMDTRTLHFGFDTNMALDRESAKS
jgi:hypothetical protein